MSAHTYNLTLAVDREDGSYADRIVRNLAGRVELEDSERDHLVGEVLGHALAQVEDELVDVVVPDAQLLAPGEATGG